jgi:hypothetical protein
MAGKGASKLVEPPKSLRRDTYQHLAVGIDGTEVGDLDAEQAADPWRSYEPDLVPTVESLSRRSPGPPGRTGAPAYHPVASSA